jgi:hypothetical protein
MAAAMAAAMVAAMVAAMAALDGGGYSGRGEGGGALSWAAISGWLLLPPVFSVGRSGLLRSWLPWQRQCRRLGKQPSLDGFQLL